MVSSKMMREVRLCYEALLAQSLEPHGYTGAVFDIVFQIITAETFVAGVASKILDREVVTSEEAAVVRSPLLFGTSMWLCDDGRMFDLQSFPEIQKIAKSIESLRSKCNDALRSA